MVAVRIAGIASYGTGGIHSGVRFDRLRLGFWAGIDWLGGGFLILRDASGNHLERVRVALGNGNFTALHAESSAGPILLAGILLLIPGFITDFLALLLLVPPLRRVAAASFNTFAVRPDGDDIIDLAPEQWHKVPDPSLPDPRRDKNPR